MIWGGGGVVECELAYLTESESCSRKLKRGCGAFIQESAWVATAMEVTVGLSYCFCARHKFGRLVQWIMLHFCDKYIKYNSLPHWIWGSFMENYRILYIMESVCLEIGICKLCI
jgi:hypothetical protein